MNGTDFRRRLFERSFTDRRPLSCTIEVIGDCNFRCRHCYISASQRNHSLTYQQAVRFIDAFLKNGGIYLTITGGDPLLHPLFHEIYQYAHKRGCVITLLSNGSLFNESTVDLLRRFPPRRVEITMYGFSEDTYWAVTGVRLFRRTIDAIHMLSQNDIPFLLKMFILKENYQDYPRIKQFAQDLQVPFKFDYLIIDRADSPALLHQIGVEQMLLLEKQRGESSVRPIDYDEAWGRFIREQTATSLFQCGAGRCTCWLKANNRLQICNFLSCVSHSLDDCSFEEAWESFRRFAAVPINRSSACQDCGDRKYCSICPAKNLTITGDVTLSRLSPFHCELAKLLKKQNEG